MFTSRAEYRILLRQDNADIRLTPLAHAIGMVDDYRMEELSKKVEAVASFKRSLKSLGVTPEQANPVLSELESSPIVQQVKFSSLITRPSVGLSDLSRMNNELASLVSDYDALDSSIPTQVEIQLKYEGYIQREQEMASKMNRLDDLKIPDDMDYSQLKSISLEAREKLLSVRPVTIGQASRISGISPSDISVLLIYLGR
jgi:tRNA uridine 5-carboxymethylaminomethyl modification enzyme